MIVAMHIHALLGEVVGDDALEHRIQFGVLRAAERDIEMFGDIPIREQAHLAQQQGFIIGRQFVVARGELDLDQRVDSCTIQTGRIVSCQSLQIGSVAEVGQQQESLFKIL